MVGEPYTFFIISIFTFLFDFSVFYAVNYLGCDSITVLRYDIMLVMFILLYDSVKVLSLKINLN